VGEKWKRARDGLQAWRGWGMRIEGGEGGVEGKGMIVQI
jgi:hypothetical protein